MMTQFKRFINKCCEKELVLEDGWIDPSKGLPDSDRVVLAILEDASCYNLIHNVSGKRERRIGVERFNPHTGWLKNSYSKIIAWKEMDKTLTKLLLEE